MVPALAGLIGGADAILVFTGAGVSTGSGIPDFRGPEGLWTKRRPIFFDEFMTSPQARVRYWEEKLADRAAWGAATPNPVHRSIVELEDAGKVLAVVTQNVDGLHADAGTAADRLIEIHGTVRFVECMSCHERTDPGRHFDDFAASGEPPRCHCTGLLKPATIPFGQPLRSEDLARAYAAAEGCDLVVSLGSTLSVTPAADVPLAAARRGVPYAIVNRGPTEHDRVADLRIEGDVVDVVPPAVALVLGT